MVRLQQGIGIVKREYGLALAHPNRAFMIVFVTLMLLGPGLASVLIRPLPAEAWMRFGGMSSGIAGFLAALLALRNYSSWLSWTDSAGLLIQVLIAGFVICLSIALPLGLLTETSHTPPPTMRGLLPFIGWAILQRDGNSTISRTLSNPRSSVFPHLRSMST
jgi:hypothetical protein